VVLVDFLETNILLASAADKSLGAETVSKIFIGTKEGHNLCSDIEGLPSAPPVVGREGVTRSFRT